MNKFITNCKAFMQDEEGLTVVEYVVGAGLLVAGLTAIFSNMGSDLDDKLSATISSIS
ncbi:MULTISPECIES: Flp family type IVb pilin [Vibrio]|uniref:Flp family type IVb pilin n=1 Tax=Vibrio cortegadensis TaxID=1328770 RepID=A0ABV4M178_9VIBR|nr:Flp family type IVb pilin [Vibrio genomosp. F6]TKF20598.1 Flp family type IVb pilin [Vibrio genomosp. F6]